MKGRFHHLGEGVGGGCIPPSSDCGRANYKGREKLEQ